MAEKEVKNLSKALGKKVDRARKTLKEVADKPITYGYVQIPAGITNGVAKVVVCGFFEYDNDTKVQMWDGKKKVPAKGETYFRMAAQVVEPVKFGGQDLRSCQTKVIVNLFDEKFTETFEKTFEQNVEEIRNHLGRIVGDDAVKGLELDDFVGLAASIQEEQPYVKFSTKRSKNPKKDAEGKPTDEYHINEYWNGSKGLEDYVEPGSGGDDETEDDTEDEDEVAEVEEAEEEPAPKTKTSSNGSKKPPIKETAEAAFDEFGDLDSLATKADAGDKKSQRELKKLALKVGLTEEFIDDEADSWADVVTAMNEAKEEPEAEEEEEEVEAAPLPAKGDVVKYKPEGARKVSTFKVTAVDEDERTVDLRGVADKTIKHTGISVDELIA